MEELSVVELSLLLFLMMSIKLIFNIPLLTILILTLFRNLICFTHSYFYFTFVPISLNHRPLPPVPFRRAHFANFAHFHCASPPAQRPHRPPSARPALFAVVLPGWKCTFQPFHQIGTAPGLRQIHWRSGRIDRECNDHQKGGQQAGSVSVYGPRKNSFL